MAIFATIQKAKNHILKKVREIKEKKTQKKQQNNQSKLQRKSSSYGFKDE